jgi:hypothetical protein
MQLAEGCASDKARVIRVNCIQIKGPLGQQTDVILCEPAFYWYLYHTAVIMVISMGPGDKIYIEKGCYGNDGKGRSKCAVVPVDNAAVNRMSIDISVRRKQLR